jgi:hypothetical protein
MEIFGATEAESSAEISTAVGGGADEGPGYHVPRPDKRTRRMPLYQAISEAIWDGCIKAPTDGAAAEEWQSLNALLQRFNAELRRTRFGAWHCRTPVVLKVGACGGELGIGKLVFVGSWYLQYKDAWNHGAGHPDIAPTEAEDGTGDETEDTVDAETKPVRLPHWIDFTVTVTPDLLFQINVIEDIIDGIDDGNLQCSIGGDIVDLIDAALKTTVEA